MSIINEALKKAADRKLHVEGSSARVLERSELPVTPEKRRPENSRPRKIGKFFVLFFVVSLLIGVLAFAFFFEKASLEDVPPAPNSVRQVAPAQVTENIVRPVLPLKDDRKNFVKLPNLVLNGIIQGRGRPLAVINDQIVNMGDSVLGAAVVGIGEDTVNLIYRDQEFVLRIKK